MPAQGVTSAFNFGFAAGALQGLVAGNAIPMHLVAPLTWKRHYKLSADKDASRRRASQLFPAHSHLWARAKDDGRAEAVLLAYYGSMGCEGTQWLDLCDEPQISYGGTD
jgi:crossover junction endodeoxyribonuclease RuvC